jgi:hypothetical protein
VVDKRSRKIICKSFSNSKRRDFRLFKESHIYQEIQVVTDSGYQGIQKIHRNSEVPQKRKEKNLLTTEDKRNNRKLSQNRVINENIIGMLKRFKIFERSLLFMDRTYEDNETRETAEKLGYIPIVPPKINRQNTWKYDKELYNKQNVIQRLFRRLKEFRRIFTRQDKLDNVFLGLSYIGLALMIIKDCKHYIIQKSTLWTQRQP